MVSRLYRYASLQHTRFGLQNIGIMFLMEKYNDRSNEDAEHFMSE